MTKLSFKARATAAALALAVTAGAGFSETLMERAKAGEPIRIGYMEYAPWSYSDEAGLPRGIMNAYALEVLKQMGFENVEPVVMEWGALTPALKAGRIDINTAGMSINSERCKNVAFSEPMMRSGLSLVVATGNPKGLTSYNDVISGDAIIAGAAGGFDLITARAAGVPEDKIMPLPGLTEIFAAIRAGRADAVSLNSAVSVLQDSGVAEFFEVSNVDVAPQAATYVTMAFRQADEDFINEFDAVQAEYLGSVAMLETVVPEGYSAIDLPDDRTLAELCAE